MRNNDHRFQKVIHVQIDLLDGLYRTLVSGHQQTFNERASIEICGAFSMCGVDTLYCEMTLVFHVRPFLFAKRRETETNLMLTLFLLQPQCYTLNYLIRD